LTPRRCPTEGGVYGLFDPKDCEMMYVGQTKDFDVRQYQWSPDPIKRPFHFRPLFRTDNYSERRGLEQLVFWQYRPPLNLINPIGPWNPNRVNYIYSATIYLKDLDR